MERTTASNALFSIKNSSTVSGPDHSRLDATGGNATDGLWSAGVPCRVHNDGLIPVNSQNRWDRIDNCREVGVR